MKGRSTDYPGGECPNIAGLTSNIIDGLPAVPLLIGSLVICRADNTFIAFDTRSASLNRLSSL